MERRKHGGYRMKRSERSHQKNGETKSTERRWTNGCYIHGINMKKNQSKRANR
jgi:hypothetical protein